MLVVRWIPLVSFIAPTGTVADAIEGRWGATSMGVMRILRHALNELKRREGSKRDDQIPLLGKRFSARNRVG